MSEPLSPEIIRITVPGRTGWQGPTSTTGLVVIFAMLALAVAAYGAVLMSDPAPAMKLLGAGVIVAVVLGFWMLLAHVRVTRVRVVRLQVRGNAVTFRGAQEVVAPLRAFAAAGALVLAGWTWAIVTVPADRLTILTLLLVPVIGLILTVVGVRAMVRGATAHSLALSQSGVDVHIPRNNLRVDWSDVREARLLRNRVEFETATGSQVTWAAMDFASDPVILAELVNFYAKNANARAEIGPGTVERLRTGNF